MKVSLDHEVHKWLAAMKVLKPQPGGGVQQIKSNGKLELDEPISRQFMNGVKFGELVQSIINQRIAQGEKLQPFFSAEAVKDMSTPGIRLYNWNLISDAFSKLNIPFDNDIKGLIIQGDKEMINEVLKDVMDTENSRNEKISRVSNRTKNYLNESKSNQVNESINTPQINQSQQQTSDEEVVLQDIDTRKPLQNCVTLLEYFLVGLSRHLSLRPKQAASLLSNGNKYLAHVIVKGAKNDFTPISNWLAEIYANLPRVYSFMQNNDVNVGIFLSTLKPGLLSKEQEVALWTLRIYNKVFFQLAEVELHSLGYEWFTRENGGLAASLMSLKRHPQVLQQICDLFNQAARYNLNDFFTVQLRKQVDFGKEYLETINSLLPCLVQSKSMKEDLSNQHLVQFWSSQAIKLAENELDSSGQMVGLQYMTYFWQYYPIIFEEDQNLSNQFLFLMKKASRERSSVLKYFSMNQLFILLDLFAKDRNPFAAILYKKLTFSLIENFDDLELRDFMINNFLQIFASYSTIPVEILLEPFIKQVQVNETQLNLSDLALTKVSCVHPRTKVRIAIQLLDLLSKVYLNNVVLAQVVFPQISLLLSRFMESEPCQEYAFKLSKVSLGLYFSNAQQKQVQSRVSDLSQLTLQQQQNNEIQILGSQKRASVVELIKFILKLGMTQLNDQIKPLLVHFYLELKQIGKEDKGLISLLNLLGSPFEIISELQRQWDEEKKQQQRIVETVVVKEEQVENEFYSNQGQVVDPFKQMKEDEEHQERLFLEQHGIGLKSKKKISKKPTVAPKVDQKVLENIAQIKLKRDEDQLNKQQEEEEKQKQATYIIREKRDQLLKRKAKEEIEKRKKLAINEEGVKDKDDSGAKSAVELFLADEEERREAESITVSLKKNSKALHYLFSKYSNSTNQVEKKGLFDELQEQFGVIQSSDIWRMCKDYSVGDIITREEVSNLVRAVNVRVIRSENLSSLEYDGFEKLMVQLAVKVYSHPQRDMRKHPAGHMLNAFMESFGMVAKKKNENHLIFLDPANLSIDPDREEILSLNAQLSMDPEMVVPLKYQKYTDKALQFDFSFRRGQVPVLPESWLDCHEIVSDLVAEIFKYSDNLIIKNRGYGAQISAYFYRQGQAQEVQTALSQMYKLFLFIVKETKSKQAIISEPDDDIDKNKKRETSLHKQPNTTKRKNNLINKALDDKQRLLNEEEAKRLEQEEKRKRHQQHLKEQYLKMKAEREEEDLRKKEQERLSQQDKSEREKRDQEKLKKEAEDRKLKLREYKEKLDDQKKQKDQTEIDEKKFKEEIRRKEREEFMKKQHQEVQKVLEDKKKQFKSKEEQEKKKEKNKQEELLEWKKNVKVMLLSEQEQRAKEKEAEKKIFQLYQSAEVTSTFARVEKQLQLVYHGYQEYSEWKMENADQDKQLLQFKGFTNFLSQFNLYPGIVTPEQGQQVYHQISRARERAQQAQNEKNGFSQAPANGMSFQEFEVALVRIAILGQKQFDTITEKYSNEMKQLDMYNLVKAHKRQEEDSNANQEEDIYAKVEQTSSKTIEGLLYYLDLPPEKSELQSKLRALKLEYQKVVAPREKKKIMEQKVGEEVFSGRTNRNLSAKRKVISAKDKSKKKAGLASVDEKDLKLSDSNFQSSNFIHNFEDVGIIGPDGKPENWKVKDKPK